MNCEDLRDLQSSLANAMDGVRSCHDSERKNELPRVLRLRDELLSANCEHASDRDHQRTTILVRQATTMLNDAIDWQRFQCDHRTQFIGHWFNHDVHLIKDSILAQWSDEPGDYASCDMETLNQQLVPSHRCGMEDGRSVTGLEKIFEGHSAPYKRAMLCGMLKLAEVYNKMARTNFVTWRSQQRQPTDEGMEEMSAGVITAPESRTCGTCGWVGGRNETLLLSRDDVQRCPVCYETTYATGCQAGH